VAIPVAFASHCGHFLRITSHHFAFCFLQLQMTTIRN